MKRIVLAAALCLAAVACTTKPTLNIENVGTGGAGASRVASAIETSLTERAWTVLDKKPGVINARIDVRDRHSATIRIPYSDTSYSIMYVDSAGLDYNAKTGAIHHNYNRWVANLRLAIDRKLGTAPPPAPRKEKKAK